MPKKCPVTLEKITKTNGIIVRVKRLGETCIYFLADETTRKTLKKCPHTRSVSEYEYAYLNNVSLTLFNKIDDSDSHVALMTLAEQITFNKGHFQGMTLARFLQGTDSFFSTARQGLQNGAAASAGAAAIVRACTDQRSELRFIIFFLSIIGAGAWLGKKIGENTELRSRANHGNPAANGANHPTTAFAYILLYMVAIYCALNFLINRAGDDSIPHHSMRRLH